MKTNYFIIHGTFGNPKDHWFGWLKKEIEKKGLKCTIPQFKTKEGINNYEVNYAVYLYFIANICYNSSTFTRY